SDGFSFSFGGSSGSGGFGGVTSSGRTISTAIGSAVTELKGCTSAKKITSSRHNKCASADAVMPDRRICRGSTVLDQRFDAVPAPTNHISIPFRRETEIGQPAPGAAHAGNLGHFVGRQLKIENIDVFRQPLDPRGPGDR